jgi:hypothetical protein
MDLVNRTLYIDANRLQSVSNTDDNSSWEYQLNNGVELPAGTEISMLQCYLNYNGINGGSIEITEDIAEEISYSFVKPQGSTFSLTTELLQDQNTGKLASDNSNGAFVYDALKHRNIQNNEKTPLLRIIGGYTSTDPRSDLHFIEARLPEYDITKNLSAPFTLDAQQPEEVYIEYFNNGIQSFTTGTNYWGVANDSWLPNESVIDLTVQNGGLGYSVGDTLTFTGGGGTIQAQGFVASAPGGIIDAVRIIQIGLGYTSDPTITISGGGAGAVITIFRGNALSSRSNNSGYGAVVGCTFTTSGSFYNVTPRRILKAGIGYRQGDILYLDERKTTSNFYPQNHEIPNDDFQTQATVVIDYTTALDFQSPGVITLSNNEKIHYARATQNPQSVMFVADDNDLMNTDILDSNLGVNAKILSGGSQSYQTVYRRFSYEINTVGAGSNYRRLPNVIYSPTGYEEEHLNTEDGEPVMLPIMNNTHGLDRVVYLGRCRDDLSASNYLQEWEIASKSQADFIGPGSITITGGLPDTQGAVEFTSSGFPTNTATVQYDRFVRPPILNRVYQQESGIQLGYSVVIVSQGTGSYGDTQIYNLQPTDPDNQNGNGAQVTVRTGFNVTPAHVLCAEITTSGINYKKHERYYIDPNDGRPESEMCIVEILDLETVANAPLPAQTGPHSSVYVTVNEMRNGISANLKNNIVQKTIFKGRSLTLCGDEFYENSGVEGALYDNLENGSLPPRYSYNQLDTLDFDNLRTCGGTEDLIGYCEFTETGHLIPKVETATLTISRGIYSVEELGKIISDQLTNSDKSSGFLNTSAFSKLVQTHSYEAALFTGKEHNKAGRGVFVSMDIFNTLMSLYKDLDPNLDVTISDVYLWDNFHQTHYYSFVKSFLPKCKPPIRQVPNSLTQGNKGRKDGAIVTQTNPYFITSVYDQLNDGFLIGTTDFVFKYDTDKSTYAMEFLHSPFRVPQYDKFGNQFSSPGTVGALVKKSCKNPIIEGIRKQFLRDSGFTAKVGEAVLDSIEQPITRSNGVMVHNFSLNVATANKTFQQPKFARFSDFFDTPALGAQKWKDSLFSRLGFTYNQLNDDSFKESVSYYGGSSVVCYGTTTNQSLDSSFTTSISTLTADKIRDTSSSSGSGAELPYQQLFNMTLPNRPLTSVYTTQYYETTSKPNFGEESKNYLFYTGSLYDATIGLFIQTDGADLTGLNLPILIKDGYFIVSSNVIDGYRDSIKKNENLPLLGVVPKNSWQSQDYTAVLSSEIVHVTSNPKVINSVIIDIYNPDLTRPILRPDSTVMLRITLPPPVVQSPEEKKKSKD